MNAITGAAGDSGVDDKMLRDMVELMPVNVMLIDLASFEVTYANKSTLSTLAAIEDLLPVKAADIFVLALIFFTKTLLISVACWPTPPTCHIPPISWWDQKRWICW